MNTSHLDSPGQSNMDELVHAIRTTPIIDNHAHPLLKPDAHSKYPLLSITTEAHGEALKSTLSSLPHLRAVKQLAQILGCQESWEDVVRAIEVERVKPGNSWNKKCFESIESVLIDDGLDSPDDAYDYKWHDQLTRSPSKRIVRIEKIAEFIVTKQRYGTHRQRGEYFPAFVRDFEAEIRKSIQDPEVVGFKSVICYRTGLNIPAEVDFKSNANSEVGKAYYEHLNKQKKPGVFVDRIDGSILNAFLVHKTAQLIRDSGAKLKKPFQFHTGLGDNDITLITSSPSNLQAFIRLYPTVPIVLLHASYPWTKEAGYLASVYENVYADIGEVFPMVSRQGQESIVREVLELCPTEKILWSTDGHWFPETYLLAVIQIREALEKVLTEFVRSGDMNVKQAVVAAQDILFNTSNKLYDLNIQLQASTNSQTHYSGARNVDTMATATIRSKGVKTADLSLFRSFRERNPQVKYLQLQYLDYTATLRARVFPVQRVMKILEEKNRMTASVTKASLALLQNDCVFPKAGTVASSGEYLLEADFSSIRIGPPDGYASVACDFKEQDLTAVDLCPRTICHRTIQAAKSQGLEFLIGFEIEIVFLEDGQGTSNYAQPPRLGKGHAWGSAAALSSPLALQLLDEIFDALANSGIHLEYFHPESAEAQYEFILPPLPPVEAIDTLIQARQIIVITAAKHNLRATLVPKPFEMQAGTAAHVHISLLDVTNPKLYQSFYAGVLKHLPAILALSYSQEASYERMGDSCWAGGTWVAWGTQNRETALRKIEHSHWEIKVVDGLANPYFVIAAIISAGTQGIADHETLTIKDCQFDPATLRYDEREELGIDTKLPKNLRQSLDALDRDDVLKRLLGNAFVERYINIKAAEIRFLEKMPPSVQKEWIIARY